MDVIIPRVNLMAQR